MEDQGFWSDDLRGGDRPDRHHNGILRRGQPAGYPDSEPLIVRTYEDLVVAEIGTRADWFTLETLRVKNKPFNLPNGKAMAMDASFADSSETLDKPANGSRPNHSNLSDIVATPYSS